ncbi:hypothetical protein GPA10_12435 [Streptomyces sp. p1417]|uniref:Uncharacterized protein n=1 Tax=Streptomyces typhae TaxID=2681492 RepID=A0A6L6WVQ0_9ACTN|nr:hypothetical protein [Streptomyces typhae]MVO85538.1 hypothetical protein [Streptomyces typhae]
MTRLGFRYTPAPLVKGTAARAIPFGLESLTPSDPGRIIKEAEPAEKPQSKAFGRALYGDRDRRISVRGRLYEVTAPATGCQAQAETRLLGDGRKRHMRLRLLLGEGEKASREQLAQDREFVAANERWRQCVRKDGVKAKNPVQLLQQLPRNVDVRKHSATRADVRCKRRTGYLPVAYATLAVAQQSWLDKHAHVLAGWRELQRRQDAAARATEAARD